MYRRPNDHDQAPVLGRIAPCVQCLHDEHVLRCEAVIRDGVLCPCRDVPVPGVYP